VPGIGTYAESGTFAVNCVKHLSTDASCSHVQRFQLMDTSSFRELDGGWRARLAWLHDDYFYRRQVQHVKIHDDSLPGRGYTTFCLTAA
jgi:hypothetical protein